MGGRLRVADPVLGEQLARDRQVPTPDLLLKLRVEPPLYRVDDLAHRPVDVGVVSLQPPRAPVLGRPQTKVAVELVQEPDRGLRVFEVGAVETVPVEVRYEGAMER